MEREQLTRKMRHKWEEMGSEECSGPKKQHTQMLEARESMSQSAAGLASCGWSQEESGAMDRTRLFT